MTSVWARRAAGAAAWLLVAVATAGVRGSVEKELSPECREFLYMGTPPVGVEHRGLRTIYQRFRSRARYVDRKSVV